MCYVQVVSTQVELIFRSLKCWECLTQSYRFDITRYGLECVEALTRLELTGLKTAGIGFLHYDLDKHSSNDRAVAIRRGNIIEQCNGKKPMISSAHFATSMVCD
jgi:hypothetical protein